MKHACFSIAAGMLLAQGVIVLLGSFQPRLVCTICLIAAGVICLGLSRVRP